MSGVFDPTLIAILGVGATVAILVALGLRKDRPSKGRKSARGLERTDLEFELEDSIGLLRAPGDDLDEEDRSRLELRAARAMKKLDALGPQKSRTESARAPRRGSALVGALYGGGGVALVAVLIFWAMRDATPRPEEPPLQAPPATSEAPFDRGQPPLPPVVEQQVNDLRSTIAANPGDVDSKRALMQLLLVHAQFFDAFGVSQDILAAVPDDPDALYTSAVVRYTMGQPEAASEILANVLAIAPAHAQSALMRGLIQLQLGDREGAMTVWRDCIAANGGNEPRLQHVLDLAVAGRSAQEILNSPPPG